MNIVTNISILLIAGLLLGGSVVTFGYAQTFAKPSAPHEQPGVKPSMQNNDELPKVVFLNQSAVLVASKKHRAKYRKHQAKLIDMMNRGVTVLVCPDCMKQYGVEAADLLDGIQMGKRHSAPEA